MSTPPNLIEETFQIQSLMKNEYLIYLSIESETLLIKANTINKFPNFTYQTKYQFEDIKKLNKYFRICDSINEVFMELKNIIKKNLLNIKINENSNNNLTLTFPLPSCLTQEVNFNIEKCLKDEKQTIEDLYKYIETLNKKIKNIEENNINEDKIKNLENKIIELEKENKSLKENIKKINEYLFSKSIFNSKISFDEEMVKNWIGKKFSANLLFSISKNGSEPSEFHRLCDNKGPTIIFIETTKGYKFGGFTELEWDQSSSYKTDSSTFLFSINNREKYTKRNNKYCSIYCRKDLAPSFGGDSNPDFFCMGSCKNGQICNTNTFATVKELNNGEKYFDVKEMEVYQIKFI